MAGIEQIKTICVIGAGDMGQSISVLCALKGFKIMVTDISQAQLDKAGRFTDSCLQNQIENNKFTPDDAARAKADICFTKDLELALQHADYVIEAVVECLDIKRQLFSIVDRLAPSHAVFATTSSTFISSDIADITSRPDRFINLHFFSPVLEMTLVELVRSQHVSGEAIQLSMALCKALGKTSLHIQNKDDTTSISKALDIAN